MFEWLHWHPMTAPPTAKDKSSAQNYLSSCVARHIQEYRDRRDSNRKNAFFIKMFSVFVGAITTVVIGVGSSGLLVGGNYPQYASILALILTASVTVISAWGAFSGHDWKWVRYRTTLAQLYDLEDDIAIETAGNAQLPEHRVREYYDRLKSILRETNAEWTKRRAAGEKDFVISASRDGAKDKSRPPKKRR